MVEIVSDDGKTITYRGLFGGTKIKRTRRDRISSIHIPNVPDDLLPLAFGTKGCSAADVPKVPKAWELGQSARLLHDFMRLLLAMGQPRLTFSSVNQQ